MRPPWPHLPVPLCVCPCNDADIRGGVDSEKTSTVELGVTSK